MSGREEVKLSGVSEMMRRGGEGKVLALDELEVLQVVYGNRLASAMGLVPSFMRVL